MLLLVVTIVFLTSPGVLPALLSQKAKLLRKPFGVTYSQVLVSTILFGILYAGLKRYGVLREGFQYKWEPNQLGAQTFGEKPCGGPENTKCILEPTGSTRNIFGAYRYGVCKDLKKGGFTCIDFLDNYNAKEWADGKLVPKEQQPVYSHKETPEELAYKQRIKEEDARKQKEIDDSVKKLKDEYMKNQAVLLNDPEIQAFIKRNYKDNKGKIRPYSSLGRTVDSANLKIKKAFSVPTTGLRRAPIDADAYNTYIARLP